MFGQGFNSGFFKVPCFTDTTDIFKDTSGVALYTFDYDASDASGDHNGDPSNIEFRNGHINRGAYFNGSNSGIFISSSGTSVTNYDQDFSISCWFRFDSGSTSGNNNFLFMGGGTENVQMWVTLANGVRFQLYNSGTTYKVDTGAISAGVFYHVVATRSKTGGLKIYLDSVEKDTDSYTGNANPALSGKDSIGQYYDGTRNNFEGVIDQVRIFNKALSAAEVSKLYAEIACVYTCTTDTVDYPITNLAYYKFDNSADDETTNNYDGTETSITYEFGRYGQAAVFNGSDSYIDLGASLLNSRSAFSVSAWVNFDNLNTQNFIFWNSESGTGNELGFYDYGNGNIYFQPDASTSTNRGYVSNSGIYTTSEWVHIVMVFDGSATGNSNRLKAYIQNQLRTLTYEGTIPSSSGTSTCNSWIGGRSSTKFSGDIDQVRVFSTALTSDQVSQLYNEKQCLDAVTAPTGNLRFDEFWAGYDDGRSNRAEFKSSGQIVDFNTYSEGHAVLNQNAQTSGKYYLEIQLIDTSGHDFIGVFNRSTNTDYDTSPYAGKNPLDANYGAGLAVRGERVYIGSTQQTSGFTDLNLTNNDIVCMAVDVDNKRIWWGRRDGTGDSSITWNSGNPSGGYGGLEVTFVPSNVIVAHYSESSSRYSEFKVLDHDDMLDPPFNFSYLDGPNTASLTENEANF